MVDLILHLRTCGRTGRRGVGQCSSHSVGCMGHRFAGRMGMRSPSKGGLWRRHQTGMICSMAERVIGFLGGS